MLNKRDTKFNEKHQASVHGKITAQDQKISSSANFSINYKHSGKGKGKMFEPVGGKQGHAEQQSFIEPVALDDFEVNEEIESFIKYELKTVFDDLKVNHTQLLSTDLSWTKLRTLKHSCVALCLETLMRI